MIDADQLAASQTDPPVGQGDPVDQDFALNPERIAPMVRRLVSPTNTRANFFDRDGLLVLSSRHLDLTKAPPQPLGPLERAYIAIRIWLDRGDLPRDPEPVVASAKDYAEVEQALRGVKSSMVRVNERGETIVSVAVPIEFFRKVLGALMLSTQGGEIDEMVAQEQVALLKIVALFLPTSLVTIWLAFRLMRGVTGRNRTIN